MILSQHPAEPPAAGHQNLRTARSEPADGTVGEPNGPAICLRTTARTGTAVRTGTIELRLAGRAVRRAAVIADSRHSGTVSITIRVHRASWNAMKPRIQCVLT
jgi:hypothetical protein